MPATKTTLLLCCLPASLLAATGESATAASAVTAGDPRPMMLWYAALAVPVLVSLTVGILSIVEFFARRGERSKADSLGGYVTHSQLNGELAKIYDEFKTSARSLTKDMKGDLEKMDNELREVARTVNSLAVEVAAVEARQELRRKPSH